MTGAEDMTEATQNGPPGMVRLTAGLGINWEAERAAFERWYVATQTKNNHVRVKAKLDGTYIDGLVRVSWRAWRKAVQRAAAGEVAVDA